MSIGARREGGAEAELVDAREALRSLGYEVVTVQNPSASELTAALLAHTSRDGWSDHASSVVALMGHGVSGTLECQDGQSTSLSGLFGLLASAPALRGKPKICLIQACRRGERPKVQVTSVAAGGAFQEVDLAVACVAQSATDDGAPQPQDDVTAPRILSDEHDFLWGYATSPGRVAYRGALFSACVFPCSAPMNASAPWPGHVSPIRMTVSCPLCAQSVRSSKRMA